MLRGRTSLSASTIPRCISDLINHFDIGDSTFYIVRRKKHIDI
nr:MAG TPA: hypothetical protein [Bacteriophage sp.]